MGGQEDLISSLRAIVATTRDEGSDPPTPAELLAYRDGRLGVAEREALAARIAAHPDAARALADLAAFPDVEPAPGAPVLSEEEIDARWLVFRERLAQRPDPEAPRPEGRAESAVAAPSGRPRSRPTPLALAAAALILLAIGLGAGFLAGRGSRDLPGPAVNVTVAELDPVGQGGVRSPPAPREMPEGSEELLLVLRTSDPGDYPEYEAEIARAGAAPFRPVEGLRPTDLGNFHLSFRREALAPGRYRIQIFGLREGRRDRVATYDLWLAGEPRAR